MTAEDHPAAIEAIEGQLPTQEEIELTDWAEKAARESLGTLNESLRQLVTLTTALLAASAGLFTHLAMPMWSKVTCVAFLMGSLTLSLKGCLPKEALIDLRNPEEIRRLRNDAAANKARWLIGASWALILALGFLLIGAILGYPPSAPQHGG